MNNYHKKALAAAQRLPQRPLHSAATSCVALCCGSITLKTGPPAPLHCRNKATRPCTLPQPRHGPSPYQGLRMQQALGTEASLEAASAPAATRSKPPRSKRPCSNKLQALLYLSAVATTAYHRLPPNQTTPMQRRGASSLHSWRPNRSQSRLHSLYSQTFCQMPPPACSHKVQQGGRIHRNEGGRAHNRQAHCGLFKTPAAWWPCSMDAPGPHILGPGTQHITAP
jgi:hypothetical protein